MPRIDRRLFKNRCTDTPVAITPEIRLLCRELTGDPQPVFVMRVPDASAQANECFFNVQSKVERDGGTLLTGWAIWEWPRVFIEAEHHAVWVQDEQLIDITRHDSECRHTLFLPDPVRAYDFTSRQRLINVKRSLNILPEAQSWIEACHRFQEYQEAMSDGDLIRLDRRVAAGHAAEIEAALGAVYVALARRTGRNERCFCRSGRKFKQCCAPLIDPND